MNKILKKTLACVARFYDERKVGDVGNLGFRRSTDLEILWPCVEKLLHEKIIAMGKSTFLDMGCADGRVNVFLSYLMKTSVGIETDEWTLDEYMPLKTELATTLKNEGLMPLPENILLFHGDSMDDAVHRRIAIDAEISFGDFDIFYTYLVMCKEFAELIAERAKSGAIFMVYGLNKIIPKLDGLRLMDHLSPLGGMLALYEKL